MSNKPVKTILCKDCRRYTPIDESEGVCALFSSLTRDTHLTLPEATCSHAVKREK